jgi:hypothetical protein
MGLQAIALQLPKIIFLQLNFTQKKAEKLD